MTSGTYEDYIANTLSDVDLKEFNRIHYGTAAHTFMPITAASKKCADENDFEIMAVDLCKFKSLAKSRNVRIGAIQHSIVLSTDRPIGEQRDAIFEKVEKLIGMAANEGVNILCLEETWNAPFFLSTRQKEPWLNFAEILEGPSTTFVRNLAKIHKIVIISPILERDDQNVIWNTAVIVNDDGEIMGKHRKNHIPIVGSADEILYYSVGNTGHPVFATKYGKIAVNICYGRHHALNWLMFGLNGAEIVFNPSATVASFAEHFWGVEARSAAFANSYYTCSINRVGIEDFELNCKGDSTKISREYYGCSYVTCPDGVRTPGLSRTKDSVLITAVDLEEVKICRDRFGLYSFGRLQEYARLLKDIAADDHKAQIISTF